MSKSEEKIFNKHFLKLLLVFLIVIIVTMTFTSFIEEALNKDQDSDSSLEESINN